MNQVSRRSFIKNTGGAGIVITGNLKTERVNQDSIESVKAFMDVYKVLMSPKMYELPPAGDRPLQGNDSHIHIMNVQRGAVSDGSNIYDHQNIKN